MMMNNQNCHEIEKEELSEKLEWMIELNHY